MLEDSLWVNFVACWRYWDLFDLRQFRGLRTDSRLKLGHT